MDGLRSVTHSLTHTYNRTSVVRKKLTAPSAVKQVSALPVFQYLTLCKTQKILTRMTPGVPEFNLRLILHAFSFDLSVSPPNIRTLLHLHTLPVLMLWFFSPDMHKHMHRAHQHIATATGHICFGSLLCTVPDWQFDSEMQSPSWKPKNSSTRTEIPQILRNPMVHYRVNNSPPLLSVLKQTNPNPHPPIPFP